eukprot:CAMPEP_0184688306 /NCGR_PEP_ID=MMETSP0312-20130426/29389_1 /TAXON_ID=31354 /ORGANISM="Compsopogon coeruleus, Strain SAG 36.94" /LENGTH=349 /DNA_ID=CAMNT_0027145313 /DNA_START=45 /DNA_END=1097 /DNA_ORIENTATION=+
MALTLLHLVVFVGVWVAAHSQPCAVNSICFAIDESGSVSQADFDKEKSAVVDVATRIQSIDTALGISPRFGAIAFDGNVQPVSPLTTSLSAFTTTVNGFSSRFGGDTRYAPALQACQSLLSGQTGVRVIVLLTDGAPSDATAATTAANAIKSTPNTFLVTVGVNLAASGKTLLQGLASGPEYFVDATSFVDLQQKTGDIVAAMCPPPVCPKTNFCRFSLTPGGIIVRKGGSFIVGVVGGSREASVRVGSSYIPISQWSPPGLAQHFSSSFFKTYSTVYPSMRSGVGYETAQQNQGNFLDMACVRLPFAAYQILDTNGNVISNINTNDPRDCVDFQVDFPTPYDTATQRG